MSNDFARAHEALSLGAFSRARKLLERAASSGETRAYLDLGLIAAQGLAGDFDARLAIEQFGKAAEAGHTDAHYWLTVLHLTSAKADIPSAFYEHFAKAIHASNTQAVFALGVMLENPAALLIASTQGESIAKTLAQDLSGSMQFLPDKLLQQLADLLASQQPASQAALGKRVRVQDGVLTPIQCRCLIELAKPTMAPALVRDPKTGEAIRSNLRTNSATILPIRVANLAVRLIERKLVQSGGGVLSHAEDLGILRYGENEEYKPHRDYLFDPKLIGPGTAGQRTRTIFCYLNEVALGGETEFIHWHERINPKLGRVVVFDNVQDGKVDPDSVHAGLPVLAGEKYLATLWLRERAFRNY
jgi:prolyl 4-hydroxylase